MREKERIEVLESLKELRRIFREREKILEEFEKLKQSNDVKEYFSLQSKIEDIEEKLNDQKIFNRNFNSIAAAEFRDEWQYTIGCNHEIYIYTGSFDKKYHEVANEKSNDFDHNVYTCLDCSHGEYIGKDDSPSYEEFEKEHFILKSYLMNSTLFYELQNEYYNSLIDHTVEISQKKLVKLFKERYN